VLILTGYVLRMYIVCCWCMRTDLCWPLGLSLWGYL